MNWERLGFFLLPKKEVGQSKEMNLEIKMVIYPQQEQQNVVSEKKIAGKEPLQKKEKNEKKST